MPILTGAVSPTELRHRFSVRLSKIYQKEVPLYADLLRIVAAVNSKELSMQPNLRDHMTSTGQMERLHYERHGAIRLGTAEEITIVARFLRLMGMQPVGYYDLAQPPACLPIHATCFRSIDAKSLNTNPFRMFVSLLRPDLVQSADLRSTCMNVLNRRSIFSERALSLIDAAEERGNCVLAEESDDLINEACKTFAWSGHATVSHDEYKSLLLANPLLADIVSFPGPHINHLTPRTLNIDAAQACMRSEGILCKDVIEGPPRRSCPILLRQTSFKALEERVYFKGSIDAESEVAGSHAARFGEIEQRGAALTQKGRALYDKLSQSAFLKGITANDSEAYSQQFRLFPDSWTEMQQQGLAYFRYYPVPGAVPPVQPTANLEAFVRAGKIAYEPIIYEDFLPLSAAGIFQSNLGNGRDEISAEISGAGPDELGQNNCANGRQQMEIALGALILDEFQVYQAVQDESIEACEKYFGVLFQV